MEKEAVFAAELRRDPYGHTPGAQLLTGLRGKDVLLVFVESYGKVAIQDPSFSPRVITTLDRDTKQLQAAGFSARSTVTDSVRHCRPVSADYSCPVSRPDH
jgi:hypothetical protein